MGRIGRFGLGCPSETFARNEYASSGGRGPVSTNLSGTSNICGFPGTGILGKVPASEAFTGLILPDPQRVRRVIS